VCGAAGDVISVTIRVVRPRREDLRVLIGVYLDGRHCADPAELALILNSDPEAAHGWSAASGDLKNLYSGYISSPRRRKTRLARAAATACWAKEGTLSSHVQRPRWIEALGALDGPF
jgi:hypothetical protein